jgi:hypothetical protein
MRAARIMDRWLGDYIFCGHPQPITRREALRALLEQGWDMEEAVKAITWFPEVVRADKQTPGG